MFSGGLAVEEERKVLCTGKDEAEERKKESEQGGTTWAEDRKYGANLVQR